MTITTTLNRIRAHSPCRGGWAKLLRHLGETVAGDEPLPFSVIVTSNGLDDALWCCRAEPGHDREWRLFGVWCPRQVPHLLTDPRSIAALDVAERYANGAATHDELTAAGAAAWAARGAARTAARDAAEAAAWHVARAAAEAAACHAAWAARAAAWHVARAAAEAAAEAAQRARFLEIVG